MDSQAEFFGPFQTGLAELGASALRQAGSAMKCIFGGGDVGGGVYIYTSSPSCFPNCIIDEPEAVSVFSATTVCGVLKKLGL